MAAFSTDNIEIGPGLLYVAPIGTTEPTSASAALPSAWRPVGWTEEGSTFNYEIESEEIQVAEEFDPVKYMTTGRNGSVAFAMAEATRQNLALALNAGAAAAASGSLEPPAPGAETRVMIVHDTLGSSASPNASQTGARWLYRRAFQTGSVEISRKKAPEKSLLAVTFSLEKPSGSTPPFIVYPDADGNV